jgi:RNA polymerase sigma factor
MIKDMHARDRDVVEAVLSKDKTDALIGANRPYIISRVSRYAPYARGADFDELLATGLSAFHEAMRTYSEDKGHFYPFADLVIKRRVIDELRRKGNAPAVLPLDADESGGSEESRAVKSALDRASEEAHLRTDQGRTLAEEVTRYTQELLSHGISFARLEEHSPKHKELRRTYDEIFRAVLRDAEAVETILRRHIYPVKKISKLTGIPQKKVERSRIYIIATVIIARGEGYESLAEYLPQLGDGS